MIFIIFICFTVLNLSIKNMCIVYKTSKNNINKTIKYESYIVRQFIMICDTPYTFDKG